MENQEWWEDEFCKVHFPRHDDGTYWYIDISFDEVETFRNEVVADITKIVAEAERRGRQAALEEVTNRMFEELESVRALRAINPDAYKKEYQYGIFQAYRIIKSKLSSLSQLPDAKINELKGV